MAAKILVSGLPNAGKTTLIKDLPNSLTISCDGKDFPFSQPHRNIEGFENITDLIDQIVDAYKQYKKNLKKFPKTLIIDSVSRVLHQIEDNCNRLYAGYDVWKNVNKDIMTFTKTINELIASDVNIILLAHAIVSPESGKIIEVCKANFEKIGGFLSTVDYAIHIEVNAQGRFVFHKDPNKLSRCLIPDIPNKQKIEDFNLQEYINQINEIATNSKKFKL